MFGKLINKLKRKSLSKMDFGTSMDLCAMPVVTFHQGNRKFNFLLDTGSNDCVIDENVLDKIEHQETSREGTLFGVEGIVTEVRFCKITLSHSNRDYTYEYIIRDMKEAFDRIKETTGVTLHGILGSKFFDRFKYVLDFDKLIAYSKL